MPREDLIQFRRGTSAQWASANPVLAVGEPGYDETDGVIKFGDGVHTWSALPIGGGVPGDTDPGALQKAANLSDLVNAAAARANLGVLPGLDLAPTAVKTSAYGAAAGDLVPVDTTSGAVTVTLPTAPPDKTTIAVKHVIQGGTNAVTVAAGGADVFNKAGGSTSLSLPTVLQALIVQYKASTGIWYVVADDLALGSLDARYDAAGAAQPLTRTVNAQTGDYTLALADRGAIVAMNKATANVLTVPTNAAVAFPVGTVIDLEQIGAGLTTIAAAGGVTINSLGGGLVMGGRYSVARLIKRATDTWDLVGLTGATVPGLNLTRTAVKTANYNAVAGDEVVCNTSGGAFAITLPTAPADKATILVKLIIAGNALTVNCGGSDVINKAGGVTTFTLGYAGEAKLLQYDSATAIWTVMADDTPLSATDQRYILPIGEVVCVGGEATMSVTVPAGYRHLMVVAELRTTAAGAALETVRLRFNGDGGGNYDFLSNSETHNLNTAGASSVAQSSIAIPTCPQDGVAAGFFASLEAFISDYAATDKHKHAHVRVLSYTGTTAADALWKTGGGKWRNTAAITSVSLTPQTTTFQAGSKMTVYALAGPPPF